jgi:hypothetical protein
MSNIRFDTDRCAAGQPARYPFAMNIDPKDVSEI